MLHVFVPKTLKDAVRDRSPSVVCGELYLYSELSKNNVWKTVGVRSEVNGYLEMVQQCSDYFTNAILEGLRVGETLPLYALSGQACA